MEVSEFLKNVKFGDGSNILETQKVTKEEPIVVFKKAVQKQIELLKKDIENRDLGIKPESRGTRWYVVKDDIAETFLRYSVKKVFLSKSMNEKKCTYEVGSTLEDLLSWYENLKIIVESGKITSIINKVAADLIAERNATRKKNENDPAFLAKKAERAEKKSKEEA